MSVSFTGTSPVALTSACISDFGFSKSPSATLIGDDVSVGIKTLNGGYDLTGAITNKAKSSNAFALSRSGHQYSVDLSENGVTITLRTCGSSCGGVIPLRDAVIKVSDLRWAGCRKPAASKADASARSPG